MSSEPALPHPCLVADVGGTNARFALVSAPGEPLSNVVRLSTGAHEDFATTVEAALAAGRWPQPRTLLLAVAGPVIGRGAELTNAATRSGRLKIDGPRLAEACGLDEGILLNDFEALSLALPAMTDAHSIKVGGGSARTGVPVMVVGPGTGLGVAALLPVGSRLLPVASEAGHVSMGPETDEEAAWWPFLQLPHVSAEELLSGRGLVCVYNAFVRFRGRHAAHAIPADIVHAALAGDDGDALEAAHAFLGLLGRFAGDMALAFRATGGVFIGGGVAMNLGPLITKSPFRARFEAKGRYADYMAAIETRLINSDDAALIGLSLTAANPARFSLDYAGRSWRAG